MMKTPTLSIANSTFSIDESMTSYALRIRLSHQSTEEVFILIMKISDGTARRGL